MKLYLAASFGRRAELAKYAADLLFLGHPVTSRWLFEEQKDNCQEARERYADIDLEDVRSADVLVLWTNYRNTPSLRNGRMIEAGYAMGLGKPVWIVGPRENLFLEHRRVLQFDDFDSVVEHLSNESMSLRGYFGKSMAEDRLDRMVDFVRNNP